MYLQIWPTLPANFLTLRVLKVLKLFTITNDNNSDGMTIIRMEGGIILVQKWFYPIESAELSLYIRLFLSLYHSKSIWRDLYQIHLINYYTCQRNMTCFASQSLVQHSRNTPIAIVSGGDSRLMWEKMQIRSQNILKLNLRSLWGQKKWNKGILWERGI